jgi:hypothetical protein
MGEADTAMNYIRAEGRGQRAKVRGEGRGKREGRKGKGEKENGKRSAWRRLFPFSIP